MIIDAWRHHYNTVRPHSSLDYRNPQGGLEGQVIKDVVFNEESGRVRIVCDRDRRRRPVDRRTGRRGQVNRLLRRTVRDVPLGGWSCEVEIEYAETFLSPGHVRVEALPFVCPKARVTTRYARLIAGMARHMPLSVVARHTGLSWNSVKAIEGAYLAETIPMPRRPASVTSASTKWRAPRDKATSPWSMTCRPARTMAASCGSRRAASPPC